jgi:hypothetical protein
LVTNVVDTEDKSLTYLGITYSLESDDNFQLNDSIKLLREISKSVSDISKIAHNNQPVNEYISFTDYIKNNSQLFVVMGVFGTISVLFNAVIQNDVIRYFAIGTSITLFLTISGIILKEWRKIKASDDDILKLTPTFFVRMVFFMSFIALIMLVATYLLSNSIMFGLIYLFIILLGSIVVIPAYLRIKENILKMSNYKNITDVLDDPNLLPIILLILGEFYLILLLLLSFAYVFNFIDFHNEWMNEFGIIALASIITAGFISVLFVTILWSGFMLGELVARLTDKINNIKKINTRNTKTILYNNFVGIFLISGIAFVIILLLFIVPGQIVVTGQQKTVIDPIVGVWTNNITGTNISYNFGENNTFKAYNSNGTLNITGQWEKINATEYLITTYIPNMEPLIGDTQTIMLSPNSGLIYMDDNPETIINISTNTYYMHKSQYGG